MPNWNELMNEIRASGSTYDIVRRKYLARLHEYTGRNVIIYYSGWLQKRELSRQGFYSFSVGDSDKSGFMTCIHQLDKRKGLDLILHTPGGDTAATESLVNYLRLVFNNNVRALVPQIAMSAGTMMACSCKSIVMGKHSSLGPIDPQLSGLPAHGIIEEFDTAIKQIQRNNAAIPVWQPIIAKYNPTLIGECQRAIDWSNEMVKEWLLSNMFAELPAEEAESRADTVVTELGDHALTKSHSRHISITKAREIGLVIEGLEDDEKLQDLVLTVHHATIHTLSETPATKIIENHNGIAFIQAVNQ